jgi:hypothetical protein
VIGGESSEALPGKVRALHHGQKAGTAFRPPQGLRYKAPALKGEGVQHKPEREQAAQDQSE